MDASEGFIVEVAAATSNFRQGTPSSPTLGGWRTRLKGRRNRTGLVTNSTLICWLFTIKDRYNKVRFQQAHNQGSCNLFLCPGTYAPSSAHLMVPLLLGSSGSNAQGESRALEASAHKALQGSEMETRELLGVLKENSVNPMKGYWFALHPGKSI